MNRKWFFIIIFLFFQCYQSDLLVIPLIQTIPLETSPDIINKESIHDVRDAFPYLVRQAKKEILISGLYFTSNMEERIKEELLTAVKRGVRIKFLLADSPYSRREYYNEDWQHYSNIDVQFIDISALGNNPYGMSHAKYAVFDDQYAFLGSANFSFQAFNNNVEINSLITDKDIIINLIKVFNHDWKYAETGTIPEKKHLFVSFKKQFNRSILLLENGPFQFDIPHIPNIRDAIEFLFNQAKKNIDLEIYMFTSDKDHFPFYYNLITGAVQRGVKVRILISQSTYKAVNKDGSIMYTHLHQALNDLKKLNIELKVLNIWDMTKTKYSAVHSKLLIVDNKYLMLGSNNYSKSAIFENRELAIYTTYTQIVNPLVSKFETDWNCSFTKLIK